MALKEYVERQRSLLETELDGLITGNYYCIPDPPMHDNKGDSAIYSGEVSFMERKGKKLTRWDNKDVDLVLLHGGGNFGDVWIMPHMIRLLFMKINRQKKVILCPQSVHYKDKGYMLKNMELLNDLITDMDITLFVRDETSYKLLTSGLNRPQIVKLVPDIAFLNSTIPTKTIQYDIVVLARTDVESTTNSLSTKESDIKTFCHANGFSVKFGDWLTSSGIMPVSPEEPFLYPNPQKYDEACQLRTKLGFEYLAEGLVIFTDRLHGHILSSLLGKPQVILDNNYGKISNYIKTWKPAPSQVILADNFDNALTNLKSLVLGAKNLLK